MEALEAIFTRRSIRKYDNRTISDGLMETIIKAGMQAPSAGGQQPWHFVIIKDRHILDEITDIHPNFRMLKEAQTAILVCGDLKLEKHKGYWVQDCSAATENILIAVHSSGLGGVWLGVYPREDRVNGIRKLLDIPENVIPFSLIPVGYPSEQKPPADRYDASKIHYNMW